jgi:hypothetical protein
VLLACCVGFVPRTLAHEIGKLQRRRPGLSIFICFLAEKLCYLQVASLCWAAVGEAYSYVENRNIMSHERSTPTSSAVRSTQDFSPNSGSHFARTSTGLRSEDAPITPIERWAMGRESDDLFRGLAGAAGGITSGFITCPLDVIKTKLQAQGGFRTKSSSPPSAVYQGLIGTGRVIWREEGLRGMYRGLGPIILGYLPTWAVWFTVYGRSKDYFKGHFGKLIRHVL